MSQANANTANSTVQYRAGLLMQYACLCVSSDKSAAEKRRQLIQESKFLGGDMEHTHLVKGLDFALLQKVSELLSSILTFS